MALLPRPVLAVTGGAPAGAIVKPRWWSHLRGVNALLAVVPVSFALEWRHASDLWRFAGAAVAIVPLSSLMGSATEELSKRLGAQWGGLLNATFGNATELIIGVLALKAGLVPLVRASIIGSVLGNLLLVLGCCALAGGVKYKILRFNQDLAQSSSISLLLAVAAIAVPAIFLDTFPTTAASAPGRVEHLSVGVAALLLAFYVATLVFSLYTHGDMLSEPPEGEPGGEPKPADEAPRWSLLTALAVLAAAAVVVSFESDFLVGSVRGATAAAGINQAFVGIIIVPIIGNAAEHATAITMALKDKMDVSISIAIGSSTQVAMFVAPFLVLASLFFAHHLTMVFPVAEIVSLAVAAIITAFIASDGKTHWLEGAQLLAAYAIIALAFFFLPG